MLDVSYPTVARQFLRALRGARSQVAHSRRLGFQSNVAAEWESGRRTPTTTSLLAACRRLGIDCAPAFRIGPLTAMALEPRDAEGIAAWLEALRAGTPVKVVAQRSRLSRHQVARFLRGQNEPRLHQFFALVDACTGRLTDFVSHIVDIERVPALLAEAKRLAAARALAFEHPAAAAIVAAIDANPRLSSKGAATRLAEAFDFDPAETEAALVALAGAGVVDVEEGSLRLRAPLLVDTATNRAGSRLLRRYWAAVGARRAANSRAGDLFSHNVFSVSREDFARIRELQTEYYQRVRAIVRKSPPEMVALLNLQLVGWEVETPR